MAVSSRSSPSLLSINSIASSTAKSVKSLVTCPFKRARGSDATSIGKSGTVYIFLLLCQHFNCPQILARPPLQSRSSASMGRITALARNQRRTSSSLVSNLLLCLLLVLLNYSLERLKKTWRSSVYGFFKSKVEIGRENGRKFHLFRCAARKCKGNSIVWRYLDSKDRAATSNLKSHANKCFGADVVNAATKPTKSGARDGSIFAAFSHPGQKPVTVSHRALTNNETR